MIVLVISTLVGGVLIRYVTGAVVGAEGDWFRSFTAALLASLAASFLVPLILLTIGLESFGVLLLAGFLLSLTVLALMIHLIVRDTRDRPVPLGESFIIAFLVRIVTIVINLIFG